MVGLPRQMAAMTGKDLLIERRSREVLLVTVPFAVMVVAMFPIALSGNRPLLAEIGLGILWAVITVFGILIALRRSGEEQQPSRDLLTLSGLDPAAEFAGRSLATFALLLTLEVVLAPVIVVMYDVRPSSDWMWLLLTGTLFAAGLSLVSTIAAGMTAGLAGRHALVPLLVAPLAVPLLVAATRSADSLRAGTGILAWTLVLLAMVLALAVTGVLSASPLREARG